MEKWICKVCGYAQHGEKAPDRCPQCGAPQSDFFQDGKKNGCAFSIICFIAFLATSILTFLSCRSSVTVDNSPVPAVDIERYLGKWYEVARFDHSFERDLVQCTANYSLREDGTIIITNRGKKNGEWKTSIGKGKLTETSGRLRVSFFGPFYSDYSILMLAPDYSYALVGGNGDNYLWILSRTPQLKQETRELIIKEARKRGYKTDSLIWVEQK